MARAAASAEVQSMIASLKAFGDLSTVMPKLTRAVAVEIERTIAAGTNPYGEPWKPTIDGHQPLRNAMKAVTVGAGEQTIFVRVKGVEAKHHLGAVWGKKVRRIIPSKKRIPDPIAAAMKRVLDEHFDQTVRHGG